MAESNDSAVHTGTVVIQQVNSGSKSEHFAAFLDCGGVVLRLKRPAGGPFRDPVLLRLEGSVIRCRGKIENGRLVLESWRRLTRTAV